MIASGMEKNVLEKGNPSAKMHAKNEARWGMREPSVRLTGEEAKEQKKVAGHRRPAPTSCLLWTRLEFVLNVQEIIE